ncbi:DUF202 domain-containing protein [Nocardia sp. NBC_00511]|uniref:DUF202 domain-containing protein n=1 Tax=Nocardia sp. NBC_00511 TaxID=2903591 RepID=UPI0030E21FF5
MTAPPTYPAERTALAWRRTALAAMGTAALFVNHAATSGWHQAAIAPAVGAIVLLFIAGISFRRNHSLHHGNWGHGPVVVVTTVAVLVVTVVAFVIGCTDPVGHQIFSTLNTFPNTSELPAATGG